MNRFLHSDMFSPTKLRAKLNSLISWVSTIFASKEYVDDAIEQAIQPSSDKEVYTVLTAGPASPENPSEGDLYINTTSNVLYKFTSNAWVADSEDAKTGVVYIASDTGHVWTYNGTAFVDSGGNVVDNVIYVHNLTTDLESYTQKGVYTVCHIKSTTEDWYSFVVSVNVMGGTLFVYKQTLSNHRKFQARSRIDTGPTEEGTWSSWVEYAYVFDPDLEAVRKIAKKALKTAKAAM